MIVKCEKCSIYYNDTYRFTFCPHDAFSANDGNNNFKVHEDSYRSNQPPRVENMVIFKARGRE